MSPQMLHGKKTLSKHAAPASERRSAMCKAQSLSSSLIHTMPAPQQRSAVCRGYPLIHMIPAPHQRLPCVKDTIIHMIPAPHQQLPCLLSSKGVRTQLEQQHVLIRTEHTSVVSYIYHKGGIRSRALCKQAMNLLL